MHNATAKLISAQKEREKSPIHEVPLTTYHNVPSGVFTKRSQVTEEVKPPLELKVNVTDTELVVVEDASAYDTNAVILKVRDARKLWIKNWTL